MNKKGETKAGIENLMPAGRIPPAMIFFLRFNYFYE